MSEKIDTFTTIDAIAKQLRINVFNQIYTPGHSDKTGEGGESQGGRLSTEGIYPDSQTLDR